jgi:uncharacterized membrane protein
MESIFIQYLDQRLLKRPGRSWPIACALAALVVWGLYLLLPQNMKDIVNDMTLGFVFVVAGWDLAVIPHLGLSRLIMLQLNSKATEERAEKENLSWMTLVLVPVISSTIGLGVATTLFKHLGKLGGLDSRLAVLLVGVFAVASAWALVHTTFALHYARTYYRAKGESRGLNFPPGLKKCNEEPNYFDFAYFSFMIGTSFQGADVDVSNNSMRKRVWAHSVLSFVFNTIVLALVINVAFNVLT